MGSTSLHFECLLHLASFMRSPIIDHRLSAYVALLDLELVDRGSLTRKYIDGTSRSKTAR